MNKKILFGTLALLVFVFLATTARSSDPADAVKDKLHAKGYTEVVTVETQQDPQPTLVIDAEYKTSTEANEKYGNVIAEVYSHTKEYKKDAGAEHIRINIYRGNKIVAHMSINENDEREIHTQDPDISILGMNMPIPPSVYQLEKQRIEDVKAKGL